MDARHGFSFIPLLRSLGGILWGRRYYKHGAPTELLRDGDADFVFLARPVRGAWPSPESKLQGGCCPVTSTILKPAWFCITHPEALAAFMSGRVSIIGPNRRTNEAEFVRGGDGGGLRCGIPASGVSYQLL